MKYQTLLSHNSDDKPAVEELARRLENDGVNCFLDKWHLIPGQPWQPALEEALEESATCVVFVGPSGLGPWQNEEMRAAISRRVSDKSRKFGVIPVVLPGAHRDQRSRLPTFLVAATWVEFKQSLEDEDAYHRLKCGIRGVPPGPSPSDALYSGQCPYRGLQVFDSEHANFFFGRDGQVDWMIERLANGFSTHQENRFFGVVGASGSGKSSLVRAGLVPALRHGQSRNGKSIQGSADWPIVILKPGTEPLKALADALWASSLTQPIVKDTLRYADQLKTDERRLHATIGTALHGSPEAHRFVIVIDQFEELFTLSPAESESERLAFIENLLYAASLVGGKAIVLITMRADFYGKCARYERLAHALSEDQELVPPLGENELRTAIERPAQLCGLELETGLIDLLLQDMRQQPAGALPLLQQTLLMLWERREGRRMTVAAYKEIGEIEGALEAHANKLYDNALRSDEERESCRRLLMMLTTPGEGTEDTRRRINRAQLGTGDVLDSVLQALAKGRLITIGDSEPVQIEVAHEALIRGWHKLRQWLDEDRESLKILHRLSDTAEEWDGNERDPAFLYRGSRLVQAEEWAENNQHALSELPLASQFLKECLSHRNIEEERRNAEEQQRIEMLQNVAEAEREKALAESEKARKQKLATRILIGFSGIAVGLAAIALWQYSLAEGRRKTLDERNTKLTETNEDLTRTEASLTTTLGTLKVALARSNTANAEIQRGLGNPLHAAHYFFNAADGFDGRSESTHAQLMGRMLLSDVTPVALSDDEKWASGAVFTSDQSRILMWQDDTVRFLDQDGREIQTYHHVGRVYGARLSADESRLLTWTFDGTVRIWDSATAEPIAAPFRHADAVYGAIFSPDQRLLLTWSADATARLWDVESARPRGEPLKHDDIVSGAVFSDSGRYVLTWSRDNTAATWDAQTGRQLTRIPISGEVEYAQLSTDASMLVTFSPESLTLWNVTQANEVSRVEVAQSLLGSETSFAGQGGRALSFGKRGGVSLWHLESAPRIANQSLSLWLQRKSGTRLVDGRLEVLTEEEWAKTVATHNKP